MKLLVALILALAFAEQDRAQVAPQTCPDSVAFTRIAAEKALETKKKLVADFEKSFPKSNHLPEAFMDLSRALIAASDFAAARQFADKAVAAVSRMKSAAAADPNSNAALQEWLLSMESATKKNQEWVTQMIAWREQQVRSSVLGKR